LNFVTNLTEVQKYFVSYLVERMSMV